MKTASVFFTEEGAKGASQNSPLTYEALLFESFVHDSLIRY